MVDLTKKPFNLNEEEIEWVNKTYESMTLDEKIGQLFILRIAPAGGGYHDAAAMGIGG